MQTELGNLWEKNRNIILKNFDFVLIYFFNFSHAIKNSVILIIVKRNRKFCDIQKRIQHVIF